jgi:hypothetical protein
VNHIPRAYKQFPTHVRRSAPHQLFLLTVRCVPDPNFPDNAEMGGAFVNCWVNRDDLARAEALVLTSLNEAGWLVEEIESWEIVTRDLYVHCDEPEDDDVNYCELFDAALDEGISCLIHTWLAGDDNEAEGDESDE